MQASNQPPQVDITAMFAHMQTQLQESHAQQVAMSAQMQQMQQHLAEAQQAAHTAQVQAAAAAAAAQSPGSQTTRAPPQARLKPSKPDMYDGRAGTDVDNFLFAVHQYCDLANEPSETSRITFAASLLKGAAATWWRALASTQPGQLPATWQDFCTLMKAQFQPINSVKIARDKLAVLKQVGSVRDYAFRFRTLLLEIPSMAESEKLDRFVRGLKPAVRREVELRDPQVLDDANKHADLFDSINFRLQGPPPYQVRLPPRSYASAVRDHQQPTPMQLDVMQSSRPLPRPKLSPPRRGQRPPATTSHADRLNGTCFLCHQPGHRAANCPQRPYNRPQRMTPAVQRSGR